LAPRRCYEIADYAGKGSESCVIKAHRLNSYILNSLCEETGNAHEQLLFTFSSALADSLLELCDEIRTFFTISDRTLQGSDVSVICMASHGGIV
jgi:hypothetical protein